MDKKVFIGFLMGILLLSGVNAHAQGEIEDYSSINFTDERTFGLSANTNGFAAHFRYGKRMDGFTKRTYEIDCALVKHPKEERMSSIFNAGRYVFGKRNVCFTLRGGLGRQKEIFSKFDKGGISIRYYYNYGVAISFLKPIYYEYFYSPNPNSAGELRTTTFDGNVLHTGNILGTASFLKGFDEMGILPGGYVKFGMMFEYSRRKEVLNAIEAGFILDGYHKKLDLMAIEDNPQFFLSMFISYRFGRVIFE